MPTFPTDESLPRCLNVLKPAHHILLLYWLFFHPSSLRIYLYQADKALLFKRGWAIFTTVTKPAYLHLYGIALIQTFLLPSLVILFIWMIEDWTLDDLFSLWLIFAEIMAFAVITSVIFGVLLGVAMSMASGVLFGVALSAVFGVVFGVMLSMAQLIVLGTASTVTTVVTGVILGIIFGVVTGILLGATGSLLIGVIGIIFFSALHGVASGIGILIGSSRSIFYIGQLLLQELGITRKMLNYDELLVLPVSTPYAKFDVQWRASQLQALSQLGEIITNPFQRYQAQCLLWHYYQQQPLTVLYQTLVHTELQNYAFFPLTNQEVEKNIDRCGVLLAELGCVHASPLISAEYSELPEKVVWHLTKRLRHRDDTRLTPIAAFIFELYRAEAADVPTILKQAADLYPKIRTYPQGAEVADSFQAFTACLNVTDLLHISELTPLLKRNDYSEPLRPAVLHAQQQLAQVSADMQAYRDATSRQNKLAAITRSLDTLEQLEQSLPKLHQPEQKILQAIIDHWQPLLTAEGGAVGRFSIEQPIENPYIAGNPITGKLFVGRDDIYREFESLWMGKNPASVVLYGHRRMGKTSILRNLGNRFGTHKHIIDFNQQRIRARTLPDLLYQLADVCYDAIHPHFELSPPQPTDFSGDPYYSFDRFLRHLDQQQDPNHYQYLVVTLDEFENLEQRMNAGTLDAGLIDYWRSVIQTYPWFILAFAGLHTLEEMRKDYFNPLFGSIHALRVSFLDPAAARQLITEPAEDFPLDYDQDVLERVIHLTHGQPYLIQQICHNLISLYNSEKFDHSQTRADRFNMADLDTVLRQSRFFDDGDYYFTGVWGQADAAQQAVLQQLAQTDIGYSETELQHKLTMDTDCLQTAITVLKQHDVIVQTAARQWQIKVPLMQLWVQEKRLT